MSKYLLSFLIFMALLISPVYSNSLYGWGHGYNQDPDLGTVYTTQAVKEKANFSWCQVRAEQFRNQMQLAKDRGFYSSDLAKKLYEKCQNGMIMQSQIPAGTVLTAVSSGSGIWSYDRVWTGEAVRCWLIPIEFDYADGSKLIFHFALPFDCGNLVFFYAEYEKPKPVPPVSTQPVPPVQETPKYQTPPMWAVRATDKGEFAPTLALSSSFGIVESPKASANANATNNNDITIANTLTQIQQMLNQITIINQQLHVQRTKNYIEYIAGMFCKKYAEAI